MGEATRTPDPRLAAMIKPIYLHGIVFILCCRGKASRGEASMTHTNPFGAAQPHCASISTSCSLQVAMAGLWECARLRLSAARPHDLFMVKIDCPRVRCSPTDKTIKARRCRLPYMHEAPNRCELYSIMEDRGAKGVPTVKNRKRTETYEEMQTHFLASVGYKKIHVYGSQTNAIG